MIGPVVYRFSITNGNVENSLDYEPSYWNLDLEPAEQVAQASMSPNPATHE